MGKKKYYPLPVCQECGKRATKKDMEKLYDAEFVCKKCKKKIIDVDFGESYNNL